MGLIGVQRTISSAGRPGADGVVVDCKIFFRCCCWFSKYSFIDVVVGWKVFFGCWRFLFINFQVWTSTGLTGFIKVGKMAFFDCLLCFSR